MTKIDIKTMKLLLSVHGADVSRWPDVDVKEALAFIQNNEEAQKLFDEAAALDQALSLYNAPDMDDARVWHKIESALDDRDVPQRAPAWQAAGVRAGVAMFACLMLIVAGGLFMRDGAAPLNENTKLATMQISATGAETQNENMDAAVEEVLIVAATNLKEQQQMEEILALLSAPVAVRDEDNTALDEGIEDVFDEYLYLENQEILNAFMDG